MHGTFLKKNNKKINEYLSPYLTFNLWSHKRLYDFIKFCSYFKGVIWKHSLPTSIQTMVYIHLQLCPSHMFFPCVNTVTKISHSGPILLNKTCYFLAKWSGFLRGRSENTDIATCRDKNWLWAVNLSVFVEICCGKWMGVIYGSLGFCFQVCLQLLRSFYWVTRLRICVTEALRYSCGTPPHHSRLNVFCRWRQSFALK